MKRKVWVGLAAMLLVGLLAALTWHCLGWMMQNRMERGQLFSSQTWPKMLDLNADQRAKLEPLEEKLKNDLVPIEADLAMNQMALCQLTMSKATIDRKAISEKLEQSATLQKRKEERVIDRLVALRALLTPSQQDTLFTTLMTDICRGCRAATGSETDHCGLCKMP